MKKTVEQLRRGDVILKAEGCIIATQIVLGSYPDQKGSLTRFTILTWSIETQTSRRSDLARGTEFEVEGRSVELTPAQQHADELLTMMREARQLISKSPTFDIAENHWVKRADALRMKIEPQPPVPPTAAEFAQALISIEKQTIFDTPEARDVVFNLIERARAAGML